MGRDRLVQFIDWEQADRNEFLVVNQFRVDPPGVRASIWPDLVLFVNGIPLVVIEAESPTGVDPIGEAVTQLRRYANQRGFGGAGGQQAAVPHQPVRGGDLLRGGEGGHVYAAAGALRRVEDHLARTGGAGYRNVGRTAPVVAAAAGGGMLYPARLLDLVRHFTLFMQPAERKSRSWPVISSIGRCRTRWRG